MSVMRVEKNSNYTVMANYHLRDKGISLKAKGLLSVMLSLPAEWDYTLAGLAHISKEGVDAIGTAVKELEYAGYVVRTRRRNEAGQLLDTDYTIYEFPQNKKTEKANANEHKPAPVTPIPEKPILENPVLDNPVQAIPSQEKPIREKAVQLNTEEKKKKEKNTDISNPYQSNIHPSIPETEHPPQIDEEAELPCEQDEALVGLLNYQARSCGLTERQIYASEPTKLPDMRKRLSYNELVRKVKDQIDYWELMDDNNRDEIENILSIMVEVMSTKCEYFTISGKQYPADLVHQRFSQINSSTIEYVLECLHKCGSDIRNIKQYLITALFNAPATCDSYYSAAVRRDFEFLRR